MKQGGQKARPSGSLSLVGCRCSELYQDGRVTLKTAVIPPILEGALGCGWAQKPSGVTRHEFLSAREKVGEGYEVHG